MTPVSYTVMPVRKAWGNTGGSPTAGVARALVAARRAAQVLAAYPGPPPITLEAAYRIQDEGMRLDGRPVAGWKVGRVPDPDATLLGSNRLAGPIFAGTIVLAQPGSVAALPAYAGGFIAIEAEYMLRLRIPAGGRLPTNDAATLEWIDEVRLGIEIASSPYPGINNDGPCVTVSDFGNNAGVLLGSTIDDWRTRDLCAIDVTTLIAGQEVGRAKASGMLDGPFGSLRFLLANLAERAISPQPGWWISSGAVTGVHAARIGDSAAVHFAGLGSLACRLVAFHA